MLNEAIILAGGLGTRLRSVVSEAPKAMAPINGRPFLEYLLEHLRKNGITRFIFSVGYLSTHIQQYFGAKYKDCEIVYAYEEKPLGTGGAIKNAIKSAQSDHLLITNGDSLFLTDLKAQFSTHQRLKADVTLALKPMQNFERYGAITLNQDQRITAFLEKQPMKQGLINGGVYIFNRQRFDTLSFPDKFSIEKDYFEAHVNEARFIGFTSDAYFLDIGIPDDFAKAQVEFLGLKL
jgi:D-glycero-alpha-D-manno-heptose 1-phosphate guanylyltransferase